MSSRTSDWPSISAAIRQQVWRKKGEAYGDPLITDRVPAGATTALHWTTTDRMLADPLTKGMKHAAGLNLLMSGGSVSLISQQNIMSVKARMKSRWTWTHDNLGLQQKPPLGSNSSPSARTTAEWLKRCAVRGVSHFGQTPKTGCHHTTVMSCFLKVAD